jgi:hypothetical protein
MSKATPLFIGAVLAVLGANVAMAQTLAQKKAREHALENQKHEIDVTNKSCGVDIKLTWDWDTFSDFDATHTEGSVASFCATALEGVGQICRESKDGKEAVAKTLKEVRCSYDKTVTPKAKFELKGGVLNVTHSYQMNGVTADAKKYMMDHL